MSNRPVQLAQPLDGHRAPRRLVVVAALVGAGLVLLWWIDPHDLGVPMCGLYRTTGLHCPGCGATRATHGLLRGRLLLALHDNALWVLSLPLVLFTAASHVRRLVWGRPLPHAMLDNLTGRTWLLIVLVAIAVVFGVLRNIPCEPFTLLAPL